MTAHEEHRGRVHAVRAPARVARLKERMEEQRVFGRAMTIGLLSALVLCTAALLLHSPPSRAQTDLFKCTDGQRVTYSSTACEKMGLKSAGAIADRITVISGDRPAPKAAPAAATKEAQEDEDKARKSAGAMKPVNPLVERLVK